jgi:hypothetical protein
MVVKLLWPRKCSDFIVVAVVLRDFVNAPAVVHVDPEAHIASGPQHVVEHLVVRVLDTRIEVEAREADLLAVAIFLSIVVTLELDDPIVLTAVSALLEVDDVVGVLFVPEQDQPPGRRIHEEAE